MITRKRVTGEDVPVPIPVGLTILGFAAAFGAAEAWTSNASAGPPPPVQPPAPVPALVATTPVVAPSASASAGPTACPRMLVVFGWGAAWLTPGQTTSVERLGTWLAAHPDATAVLDGHADSQGSDHGNLDLSRRRAASVAQVLQKQGIAKNRLTVRGFGAFSPVEGEADDAARNRRVVVQIRGTSECPLEREEVTGP